MTTVKSFQNLFLLLVIHRFYLDKSLYILRESTLFIDICYKLTNLRTLIISDSDDKIIVMIN